MRAIGGRCIQLKRDEKRNLEQLMSPSGYTINFKYDSSDRIIEATDYEGNVRKYSYDAKGYLETVADSSHLLYRFKYKLFHFADDDRYLMTAVLSGTGTTLLENIYGDGDRGRVSEQRLSNGDVFRYQYTYAEQRITRTVVDGPMGKRTLTFR